LRLGSSNRANAVAGAALDAGIRIDFVFAVTLGNCGDGALSLAGAAADAIIRNFISHWEYTSFMDFNFILSWKQKKTSLFCEPMLKNQKFMQPKQN
jgi:hypothetical protein